MTMMMMMIMMERRRGGGASHEGLKLLVVFSSLCTMASIYMAPPEAASEMGGLPGLPNNS